MKKMGKYCKAYPIETLKRFGGWTDSLELPSRTDVGGGEKQDNNEGDKDKKDELALRNYVFIQEDYTVTRDIFIDEEVVLAEVTPEWTEFCRQELHFEVPSFDDAVVASPEKK